MNQRNGVLDVLRVIACLLVIAFHLIHKGSILVGYRIDGPVESVIDFISSYGWWGVPLFFSISGYVIFMTAENVTVKDFVRKRFNRLFPIYWMAITVTAFCTYGDPEYAVSIRDLLINLTMLQHLFPVSWNVQPVDGAYWSLSVELQFYFLVAIMIATNQLKHVKAWMIVWLFLSAISQHLPWRVDQILCLKWAPFFSIGMITYLNKKENASRWSMQNLVLFVLAADIGMRGIKYEEDHVLIGLMLAQIIVFCAIGCNLFYVKSTSVSTYLGMITYPIYLIHQNVGYVVIKTFYIQNQYWSIFLIAFTIGAAYSAFMIMADNRIQQRLRVLKTV